MRTSGDEVLTIQSQPAQGHRFEIPATYVNVVQHLRFGCTITGPGFKLKSPLRDGCGYCEPIGLLDLQIFSGFTDNHYRPGIICQQENTFVPRGHEKVILPGGTRLTLAKGSFIVDADVFDEILSGQILIATR